MGPDARRGLQRLRRPAPRRGRRSSTSSGTLTFARDPPSARTRWPTRWSDLGIGEGDGVAILCRNHRGFIDATVACSKLGANALYLNTMFAGPQITDVCEREKPKAIVYDQEFAEMVEDAGKRRKRFVAWFDGEDGKPAAATRCSRT